MKPKIKKLLILNAPYCPKSVDMENFGERQIASFIAKLNRRPRKCLGWKSPFEVFFNTLLHLT